MFPFTRLRRLRKTKTLRDLTKEIDVTLTNLIYPIFVEENCAENTPIPSLPGQSRIAEKNLAQYVKTLYQEGIRAIILFGVSKNKDTYGTDTLRKDGLLARMIETAKTAMPDMLVISDNCFCEYTEHGHCGVIENNEINNDKTIINLGKQAVICAQAGADIIAPSAMMDGQIQAIRQALDNAGFYEIPIMAYSTKFSSSFYGPFREASHSQFKGDRKSYQMPYTNRREALRESIEDEKEGADFLMVKPAGLCLDIISDIRSSSLLPIVAYQVSGEYAAIKFAAQAGALSEQDAIYETLSAIKRAGASIIITYFAREFAKMQQK